MRTYLRTLAVCVIAWALVFTTAAHAARQDASADKISATAHGGAVRWPGRPDKSGDAGSKLLPMQSGSTVGLRSVGLGLFCNIRDVDISALSSINGELEGSKEGAGAGGSLLKGVLACSEEAADGPGGSLLVIGTNYISNQLHETDAFFLKSQRANKFCAPKAVPGLAGQDGAAGPLVVVCDKMHYDNSCKWRANVSASDPRVVYLQPVAAGGQDAAPENAGADTVSKEREHASMWCSPRGPEGLVVCDSEAEFGSEAAALEVVASGGYGPGGGDGGSGGSGDNPYYPGGGGSGDNPYYPGGGGSGDDPYYPGGGDSADGGKPYYPGGGDSGSSSHAADSGGDPGYPGGGWMGGKGSKPQGKGDKLPFRTGATLKLVSPWLDASCDCMDAQPWYSASGAAEAAAARRLLAQGESEARLASISRGRGRSGSALGAAVWCNSSTSDGPSRPYPAHASKGTAGRAMLVQAGGEAKDAGADGAAAREGGRGGQGAAGAVSSPWDLTGFILMGTDFSTADIYSGSKVFLKSQLTRKFCRVMSEADAADGRRSGSLGRKEDMAGFLICDEMTSGARTELIVELAEKPHRRTTGEARQARRRGLRGNTAAAAAAPDGGVAGSGASWPSGGGGDWPSGGGDSGGDWPHGGGDDKAGEVYVQLRDAAGGMRYCAPDYARRGSPIVCDMKHPDTSKRALTTFQLVNSSPW